MVSEALSCILNFKNFLGEAPHTPPTRGRSHPPLVLSPPRVFDARAHAFGMSNFPNFKGTGTFPIWWIKSLTLFFFNPTLNIKMVFGEKNT